MALMEQASAAAVTERLDPSRQTMRLDRVFWSHFSPNLGPGGWVTGVLLVHLGLDLKTGLLAILVGNLLGAIPVALAAVIGPVTGLPQMESARRVFGRDGLRLPAFLNWIYCVGWDAVNNVPATAALLALLALFAVPLPFALGLAILVAVQMLASIYGHDVVQDLQKYLGAVLLAAFAVIGLTALFRAPILPIAAAHPTLPQFILATAILASFNLSWASYSSDYTRYLPPTTAPRAIVTRALAALLLSAIPFQVFGLITAGSIGEASPTAVITNLRHAAGPFGPIALFAVALSSVTGNSVNDNTAAYSLISAGIRVPRVLAAIVTALLGYALAVAGSGHYADFYAGYLVLTLYWIAPWTGIILADWWMNPGRHREARQAWMPDATLFIVVSVLTVLLFSSTDLYTGPIARALGGADIGYYVGFAVAFAGTVMLAGAKGRGSAPATPPA